MWVVVASYSQLQFKFKMQQSCKNKLVVKLATLKTISVLSIMKVKQSISFEQKNLDQAKSLADTEQTSLSFIVNRALFHYLNQSPTILRHEKSTPPLALDGRKNSGNNRTVRNRVKSD